MSKQNTHWPIMAAVAALFLFEAILFLGWIPDDAFISFRYARNLAEGLGPVFNPGERVEGASNPLWTAFLGLLTAFGLETAATAVVLSLICSLLSVWLSMRLFDRVIAVRDDGGPSSSTPKRFRGYKALLALGLVASLPMVFYSTSGLETHAELMFLLLGVILHLEARAGNSAGRYAGSQLSFLAVALLRPEGISFLILGAAFALFGRARNSTGRNPVPWIAVVLPVAIYVVFFAVKASYYGAVVPNTYLAKPGAGVGYLKPLSRGLTYTIRFFAVSGLVTLLPFCAIALARPTRRYACVFLGSFVLVQLLFIVFVGGDVLRFDRFTVPFTPLLLAIALAGIVAETERTEKRQRLWMGVLATCVALMVSLNGGRTYLALKKVCYHDWMHAQVHRQIGEFLNNTLRPDASIVVNEVGAIGYGTGMVTYDMIGLTDVTVGQILYESYHRFGVSGSEWSVPRIANYLLEKEPDCIVIPSYGPIEPDVYAPVGKLMHPIWEGVFIHPDLARHYTCGFSVRIHSRKYWYVFFRDGAIDGSVAAPVTDETRCMNIRAYAHPR